MVEPIIDSFIADLSSIGQRPQLLANYTAPVLIIYHAPLPPH